MLEKIKLFPIRITASIIIMITIFFLMFLWFIQQPLTISLLNAGQSAHEASGTWTGSVVTTYAVLRMIANLTVPAMIAVLIVYWLVRTQRKEWRSEYEQ